MSKLHITILSDVHSAAYTLKVGDLGYGNLRTMSMDKWATIAKRS